VTEERKPGSGVVLERQRWVLPRAAPH